MIDKQIKLKFPSIIDQYIQIDSAIIEQDKMHSVNSGTVLAKPDKNTIDIHTRQNYLQGECPKSNF